MLAKLLRPPDEHANYTVSLTFAYELNRIAPTFSRKGTKKGVTKKVKLSVDSKKKLRTLTVGGLLAAAVVAIVSMVFQSSALAAGASSSSSSSSSRVAATASDYVVQR